MFRKLTKVGTLLALMPMTLLAHATTCPIQYGNSNLKVVVLMNGTNQGYKAAICNYVDENNNNYSMQIYPPFGSIIQPDTSKPLSVWTTPTNGGTICYNSDTISGTSNCVFSYQALAQSHH